MTNFGPVAIGAFLLVVGLVMRHEGKLPRGRAWIFFGAGATLGAGLVSTVVTKIVRLLEHATAVTTLKAFGEAIPLLLLVGLVTFLFFKLIPKGAGGHNWADYLMFLLPAILTGAGGSWALLSVDANHATTTLASYVISTVQSLAVGW